MKSIYNHFIFLLVMISFSCESPEQILRIGNDTSGMHISYDNLDRLIGLNTEIDGKVNAKIHGDFIAVTLRPKEGRLESYEDFYSSFFDSIPKFKQGMALWRYKPWNAWSKPLPIKKVTELKDWDIQFFYWEYEDGLFGAAMPLSGNGYRTTLGNYNGKFGAKSSTRAPSKENKDSIPQMLIGFEKDPHLLFKNLFKKGLSLMGKSENMIEKKMFPSKLDYIGWCTWNASDNGKKLDEDFVVDAVKTFTDNNFPLGWVIVDDGWLDHIDRKIKSFKPDSLKFPNGFKPLTDRLRNECHVREIGIWQTFNGYWNGIHLESELGKKYHEDLFSYYSKKPKSAKDSLDKQYFIKPESPSIYRFYREMHERFKSQGFSFIKVDNQLITEKMAVNNYPIFSLSEKMHEALYASADEFFEGAVINCMDMTAEAYLNFGNSAIARAVEDYFPAEEDSGVGYKLPYGNAAVHVLMSLYNSIYFQQMVFPDFDMFESHNPDAEFHAVARAINNGPIYITDKPGEQNFEVLRKLCYSDGHLIRSSTSLTPTADCLFQTQEPKIFKAFSRHNETGLLGAWNMADAQIIEGTISPDDVHGLIGDDFIVYEYFSGIHLKMRKTDVLSVVLSRMDAQLFYIIPAKVDAVVIGLVDKYNAPGTVLESSVNNNELQATVADHGTFGAIIPKSPKVVLVDGIKSEFEFENELLTIQIKKEERRRNHLIEIEW